jgi:protocatechuate 3,4-dioxygenase beta subunit
MHPGWAAPWRHAALGLFVLLGLSVGCGRVDSAPSNDRPEGDAVGTMAAADRTGRVPVLGGPCEGCELVFLGMPDSMDASARIAPTGEPGEPMTLSGTVRDASGRPRAGIVVYAYHTDAKGHYPRSTLDGNRHGTLRGWARTDEAGRYRFDTIRPASYPETDIPQHVHMHVIEPHGTYYIDDVHFRDDRFWNADQERALVRGRGGPGLVTPTRDDDGRWHAVRGIVLGHGIPGYPAPDR